MAQCLACDKEMEEADGCDPNRVITFVDGETANRIEYGDETRGVDSETGEERTWSSDQCHDCGASKGHVHHPVCDVEECPRCGGLYLTCGCDTEEKRIIRGEPVESDPWEDEITERGKWVYAGSDSIEEMADSLEDRADWLREKDAEGYRLMDADEHTGYWFLRKVPEDEF